jgi:endoglucanase
MLLVASTAALAVAAPVTKKKKKRTSKHFTYFGVNESGAEFRNTAIPGQLGKDYTFPPTYDFSFFLS